MSFKHQKGIKEAFDIVFNVKVSDEQLNRIFKLYSAKYRYYHNADHVDDLIELAAYSALDCSDYPSLSMLILIALFHDVIYDPRSKTNEIDSERYFKDFMWYNFGMSCDDSKSKEISQAILDTKYEYDDFNALSSMSKSFIMLDCHNIFQEKPNFDQLIKAEKKLFKEFQFVPYAEYKKAKMNFLKKIASHKQEKYRTTLDAIDAIIQNFKPRIGLVSCNGYVHHGVVDIVKKAEKIFDKVIIVGMFKNSLNENNEKISHIKDVFKYHEVFIIDEEKCEYNYQNYDIDRHIIRNGYDVAVVREHSQGQYVRYLRSFSPCYQNVFIQSTPHLDGFWEHDIQDMYDILNEKGKKHYFATSKDVYGD